MRNLKKVLALALALVMALSMMTVANAFTDSEKVDAVYTEAVDVLAGMGVFEGYEDGSFKPQGDITRAEVAAIVYRLATADVNDKNVSIHKDYGMFADVPNTHWAAGYIGYCAHAGLIAGYGDGNFGPSDKVTGYQALAMILRAVGYDVNGEFKGEGWEVEVAELATNLGLLRNITKGSLAEPATRELVAEVLFQTANKAYLVSWTNAFGYQPIKVSASGDAYTGIWNDNWYGPYEYTLTLGLKNFGLAYDYAYVVANAGTHETATWLAPTSTDYEEAVAFDFATDRDEFGHAVKVWHDIRDYGTTYAWYDLAVSHEVVAGYGMDLDDVVEGLVKAGRITTEDGYEVSEAYGLIGEGSDTESGIYVVVDNGKNDIVIVATDVTIDTIIAKNNYLKDKTVRFWDEGVVYQAQVANLEKHAVGSEVIFETIVGTSPASPKYDVTYVIDAISYTTGVITDIDTDTFEITLKGGKTLEISPLAYDLPEDLYGGITYNFALDAKGCYIDLWPAGDEYAELIATWAWYKTSGDSEDEYSYKVMGVDANGEKVTYDIDMDTYYGLLQLGVKAKYNVGADTDLVNNGCAAVVLVNNNGTWALTDYEASNFSDVADEDGLLVVTAGEGVYGEDDNYLIDESTVFYFVSGNSTSNLKVTKYNGTTELVGKGGSYTLDAEKVNLMSCTELKSNIVVGENYHVDTIVIVDRYVTVELGSVVYVPAGTKAGSVLNKETETRKLPVYIDGEKTSIPVLDEVIGEYTELESGAFYTYKIVNGVYILEEANGLIDAEVLTAGTIGATVTLKADGELYTVSKNTVIVTLPGAQKVIGENVNTYAEFVELAMQLTEVGTIEGIQVDAALSNGAVTTIYITTVAEASESAAQ